MRLPSLVCLLAWDSYELGVDDSIRFDDSIRTNNARERCQDEKASLLVGSLKFISNFEIYWYDY